MILYKIPNIRDLFGHKVRFSIAIISHKQDAYLADICRRDVATTFLLAV